MIEIITSPNEKKKTRPLYEQAFHDPQSFTDYYYDEKCKDNVIVAWTENGNVLSMCHLNPYTLVVCGKEIPSYYLVAVATDLSARHKGLMTKVLKASFSYMEEQKVPFCYLLPVDPKIYDWIGFRTICDFQMNSGYTYETIKDSFNIYCRQDERYCALHDIEQKLAASSQDEDLPEHPVMMAKVISLPAFSAMAGKEIRREEDGIQWLLDKKCFFQEEV